jgi:1-acyl-sn-glycerol-3-phosphate acyltransferase
LGRRLFLLTNLVLYWGALPFGLIFAARQIDALFTFPSLPIGVGLGVGIPALTAGIVTSLWTGAVLYLRGGGFPIALLPPSRLVREGPYELSRHPLYVAFILYLIGWGALARSLGFFAFVLPGFVVLVSGYALFHEERVLLRRFGGAYRAYRKEVPFILRFSRARRGPGVVFSIIYLVGKFLVRLLFPLQVEGREHLPHVGPAVVVANHACYLDPVFLGAAADRYIRYLTTGEMIRTRFGRWLFPRLGSIPVRRYRTDATGVRGCLTALKRGEIVGIFPEGERCWDGNPLPVPQSVKKLLRRLAVPIIPARIEDSYAIYPRWSGFPLPGRVTIRFLSPIQPPFTSATIDAILGTIAVRSAGRTWLPRSAKGIERLLWACPTCREIGSIVARRRTIRCAHCGATWRFDRGLVLHGADGETVPLLELSARLDAKDFFQEVRELRSIGGVDLLKGGEKLNLLASGELYCRDRTLRIDGRDFPLPEVRILRLEGRDRLDLGFGKDRRLRLRFEEDSPLKWQQFLARQLTLDV